MRQKWPAVVIVRSYVYQRIANCQLSACWALARDDDCTAGKMIFQRLSESSAARDLLIAVAAARLASTIDSSFRLHSICFCEIRCSAVGMIAISASVRRWIDRRYHYNIGVAVSISGMSYYDGAMARWAFIYYSRSRRDITLLKRGFFFDAR